MILKNHQIHNYASQLSQEFGANCNIKLPVKINFYLQKNIETLRNLAIEIEKTREQIIEANGSPDPNGQPGAFIIAQDKIEYVSKELQDLANLEQDVHLYPLKLDNFDGIDLDFQQMSAIMFMIEE